MTPTMNIFIHHIQDIPNLNNTPSDLETPTSLTSDPHYGVNTEDMTPFPSNVTPNFALSGGVTAAQGELLSFRDRQIYEVVNYVFLGTLIGLFGVVTNVINIIIFLRQGLRSTVNIGLFSLAVSDLCSLLTLQWFNVCVNPYFERADDVFPLRASEIIYLTAGIPHDCFARITCWLTVYITGERCLCILLPLRIKRLISPAKTTAIIVAIYVTVMASFTPEYVTAYIDWKFYPDDNRTLLGLVFTEDRGKVEGLTFLIYGILGKLSFLAVIFFTSVLVITLRRKTKWRRSSVFGNRMSENVSSRDRKTVNMIILIALILIICYTPGIVLSMVTVFEPEFSIVGRYVNLFFAVWSFGFLLETVNSSVNIFLFYRMSSKYRRSFHKLFAGRCGRRNTRITEDFSTTNISGRQVNENSLSNGLARPLDSTLSPAHLSSH